MAMQSGSVKTMDLMVSKPSLKLEVPPCFLYTFIGRFFFGGGHWDHGPPPGAMLAPLIGKIMGCYLVI